MHIAAGLAEPFGCAHLKRQEEIIHRNGLRIKQSRQQPCQRALAAAAGAVDHNQLGFFQQNLHQLRAVAEHHAVGGMIRFAVSRRVADHRAALCAVICQIGLKILQGKRRFASLRKRFNQAERLLKAFAVIVSLAHDLVARLHHPRNHFCAQCPNRRTCKVQPAQAVSDQGEGLLVFVLGSGGYFGFNHPGAGFLRG